MNNTLPFDFVRKFCVDGNDIYMDDFLLDEDLKERYYKNVHGQVFKWHLNERQLRKHQTRLLLEESMIRDMAMKKVLK